MNRLLAILFLALGFLLLPAVALAQDEPTETLIVNDAGEPELPPQTENSDVAITGDRGSLDAARAIEQWNYFAVFLPVVIAKLGAVIGWKGNAKRMAQLAVAVYFGFATIGEFLKGTFDTIDASTPQLLFFSLINIAFLSYASYKIVGNAKPNWVGGVPGPSS
jgi:hypothetical protein